MGWQFVLAMVLAVSIILFPAVLIWYLNVAGIYAAVRDRMRKQAAANSDAAVTVK